MTATAKDPAGNEGTAKEPVDGIAPTIDITPINPKDPITGTTEPGADVTVKFPDGTTVTTVADSKGDWTVPNPGNLTNGQEVTATAKDPAGNEGTAKEEVDGVNTVNIDPITQKDIDDPKDPITGTGEVDATVTVTFSGGMTATVTVAKDGTWTVPNPGNLKDGDVVTVISVDKAGNTANANEKVDGISLIDIDPINLNIPGQTNPPITGKAEADSKVTVTFPDGTSVTVTAGKDGKWSVTNPGNLKDGEVVKAISEDVAGNQNGTTETTDGLGRPAITQILDNVTGGLEGNILIPHSNDPKDESEVMRWDLGSINKPIYASNDLAPVFVGTGEPGAVLTIFNYLTGSAIGSTVVDVNGNWTYSDYKVVIGGADKGALDAYYVEQTDKVGNVRANTDDPSNLEDLIIVKYDNNIIDASTFRDYKAEFEQNSLHFNVGEAAGVDLRVKLDTVRFYGTTPGATTNDSIYIVDINGKPIEGVKWTMDGNKVSAEIPASFKGSYTLNIPAGSYQDYAGNANLAYHVENTLPILNQAFDYVDAKGTNNSYTIVDNGGISQTNEVILQLEPKAGSKATYYLRVDGVDDPNPITVIAGDSSYIKLNLADGAHTISYAVTYEGPDRVAVTSGYSKDFNITVVPPAANVDSTYTSTEFDDHFDTTNGGQDTVIYKILSGSVHESDPANMNNGHDTWVGFGVDDATGGKDTINIMQMLSENKGVTNATIGNFISVKQVDNTTGGKDTVLSVDRDGAAGTKYNSTEFLTLKDVDITLDQLLKNNQLFF